MYKFVNLAAVTAIALFKPPVKFVALYTIVDCFFVNRKKNRGVQLLTHHVAVLGLCTANTPNREQIVDKLLDIELSTALVMCSKIHRSIKPLAMIGWVYQRCLYLPRLIMKFEKTEHHAVGEFSLKLIRNLGFLWTLEGFKVPQKFLKPCIFSATSYLTPVVIQSWRHKKYFMSLHTLAIIATNLIHTKYEGLVNMAYIFHVKSIQTNAEVYIKWVTRAAGMAVLAKKMDACDQEWTNMLRLLPRMGTHVMIGLGVNEILEKRHRDLRHM